MPSQDIDVSLYVYSEIVSHLFWKDVVTVGLKGDEEHVIFYLSQWPTTPQCWIQKQSAILHQTHAMELGRDCQDLSFTLTTSGSASAHRVGSFYGYEEGLVNVLEWETAFRSQPLSV